MDAINRRACRLVRCATVALFVTGWPAIAAADVLPRYEHIFIIILENHGYDQIIGDPRAPTINRLAATYGSASRFYAEVHPSEGNYVAMIGGDTFGIHDDDAWYCAKGNPDRYCASQNAPGPYPDHTITARSLIDQLADRHLSWKGYFESLPAPGSRDVYHPDRASPVAGVPNDLYASKHNGFINFKSVQDDPELAQKFVGFDQLHADLANGSAPNYAHIVPNQCNDMHGLVGPDVPDDCRGDEAKRRADAVVADLIATIERSPLWADPANAAIVLTWDEGGGAEVAEGCCGVAKGNAANFGGGHIPTVVITNHGPRGRVDDTPYNHYSLLRTTEEALGMDEFLGHANDQALGVQTMTLLFAVQSLTVPGAGCESASSPTLPSCR
jgi:phosphatidylinositol-3-phosphatase